MSDLARPLPATGTVSKPPPRTGGGNTCSSDENIFLELRRKVQDSELLSSSIERLLLTMHFNGRLTVVIHNGRIYKSAYEEGYFRRKNDLGGS